MKTEISREQFPKRILMTLNNVMRRNTLETLVSTGKLNGKRARGQSDKCLNGLATHTI